MLQSGLSCSQPQELKKRHDDETGVSQELPEHSRKTAEVASSPIPPPEEKTCPPKLQPKAIQKGDHPNSVSSSNQAHRHATLHVPHSSTGVERRESSEATKKQKPESEISHHGLTSESQRLKALRHDNDRSFSSNSKRLFGASAQPKRVHSPSASATDQSQTTSSKGDPNRVHIKKQKRTQKPATPGVHQETSHKQHAQNDSPQDSDIPRQSRKPDKRTRLPASTAQKHAKQEISITNLSVSQVDGKLTPLSDRQKKTIDKALRTFSSYCSLLFINVMNNVQ